MTHGAILLDGKEPGEPGAATAGCRDNAMAPMIATKAAKRSSEEKARRQCDGVEVEEEFRFVIIGIPMVLNAAGLRTETETCCLT
jgi:hypothetical protein